MNKVKIVVGESVLSALPPVLPFCREARVQDVFRVAVGADCVVAVPVSLPSGEGPSGFVPGRLPLDFFFKN